MIVYDIFISYKRISLPTANNLYYRLTTRGYSAFFDLEEMRKDNFDVQLYNYIEKSGNVYHSRTFYIYIITLTSYEIS